MIAHYSYEPECVKGKPDGYYLLRSPGDEQGTLVYLYNHADFKGRRHLAFGAQDGGGLLPVADLRDDARLTPVQICEADGKPVLNIQILAHLPAPDAGEEEER